MRLTFIGTGDAFGAGGRLQTCLHVEAEGSAPLLIDCGATALIGLRRFGLAVEAIEGVVITHLHGDHFAGLIWLLLDGAYGDVRSRPLTIYGPPTTADRLARAIDVFYPGALRTAPTYGFSVVEMQPRSPVVHQGYVLEAVPVDHPSGAPSYGVRVTAGGRQLAFTGDTAWTEAVVELGVDADVYAMDCWQPEGAPAVHLSFAQISSCIERMPKPRIILTHMSAAMLEIAPTVETDRIQAAYDGLVIDV